MNRHERRVRALLGNILDVYGSQYYGGNFDAADDIIDLGNAIEKADLTGRQKTAIRLYYLEGFEQEEIASMTGKIQSTISRHIDAAIRKISQQEDIKT